MKKLLIIILFLFGCSQTPLSPPQTIEGKYIMTYTSWKYYFTDRAFFKKNNAEVYSCKSFPIMIVQFTNIDLSDQSLATYVEKDIKDVVELHDWQWNIKMVNADYSYDNDLKGDGVKVIIIDTGVFTKGQFFQALDTSLSRSVFSNNRDINDMVGHGSHVFGILAGTPTDYKYQDKTIQLRGIAPGARVGMIKMFDDEGTADLSDVIKAVDLANYFLPDVVSMSWGMGYESISLSILFNRGYANGIVYVASSGNYGREFYYYPASFPEVISVGAVDSLKEKATFSTYGKYLDVMAPGVDVVSIWRNYPLAASGTSMAAPHVAGAAALFIQEYKKVHGSNPPVSLTRTALRVSSQDLPPDGWDRKTGYGLLQIKELLKLADEM